MVDKMSIDRNAASASRIKEAAKQLFLDKGYDGTTMQAIADAAKVNKMLLHYYFQNKDNLFLLIFDEELSELTDFLATVWQMDDCTLLEQLDNWIDSLAAFVARNPQLPLFLITEMTRNPDLINKLFTDFRMPPQILGPRDIESEPMSDMPVRVQLVGTVYSLLFFPALSAPLSKRLLDVDSSILEKLKASHVRLAKDLARRMLNGSTFP